MRNLLILSCSLLFLNVSAQDHFSGINMSRRVGILNAGINPAELANIDSKYEINVFAVSMNAANNKVGFSDIIHSDNIEDLIFSGDEPVNMRVDAELYGPGFAMKWKEWAFGLTTKAYAKLNLVDIDSKLGEAINTGALGSVLGGSTTISNNENQRMNGTTWGEVGLTASRNLFENEKHKFNAGVTFKLLFPGSYANFGADKFQGTISSFAGQAYLNDTNANLNIAYSGNLADSFTNFDDYSQSFFGKLNGVAGDIGFNYRWKDIDNYKVNAGMSIRNIGSMTFKDSNNSSSNYLLEIPAGDQGINLNQFQDVDNLQQVEQVLQDSGYLTSTKSNKDFKVKLPTVFSLYADVKVVSRFFVSVYTQQKLGDDNKDDQVTTQNTFSVTPRFSLKNYDIYSSWASNEISGVTGGFGFRAYGFYLGSSSILTALTSDTKQADAYIGYRVGLK
ncbi:hypothetical protein [Flavobacterium sp. GT3R68]|uniref:hypothetical protein n=1 Tax=Flavobacterium sp. GT3R68 TaxID=2594437 RepID=UPI000F86113E|nr:hypothetical protein [Flavobacterium sp. GT3R68]RTY94953.1 hypothetical protein EKL32_08515 [Flavobacterium sp. GSN2]TRW91757.1 hypothetical protein FNW07_07690 [Flavobacterium sp. GT3R68]